jgi:hypothetical protein
MKDGSVLHTTNPLRGTICSPILVIFGDGVVIFVCTRRGPLLERFAADYSNYLEVAVGSSLQNEGDMFENRDMGWS